MPTPPPLGMNPPTQPAQLTGCSLLVVSKWPKATSPHSRPLGPSSHLHVPLRGRASPLHPHRLRAPPGSGLASGLCPSTAPAQRRGPGRGLRAPWWLCSPSPVRQAAPAQSWSRILCTFSCNLFPGRGRGTWLVPEKSSELVAKTKGTQNPSGSFPSCEGWGGLMINKLLIIMVRVPCCPAEKSMGASLGAGAAMRWWAEATG